MSIQNSPQMQDSYSVPPTAVGSVSKESVQTGDAQAPYYTGEPSNRALPLLEHFAELRACILKSLCSFILAAFLCFFIKDYLLEALLLPYRWAMLFSKMPHASISLQSTQVWETFFVKTKVACFAGAVLCFPYFAYQLYHFLSPGLYKAERRYVHGLLYASPALFFLGAAFVYFLLAPFVLCFALAQQFLPDPSLKIQFIARIGDYLHFIMCFVVAFGVVFQMPLIVLILVRLKALTAQGLQQKRKYAFLIVLVFSAAITPPDVFTMFAVAIPIMLVYEASILVARWANRRLKPLQPHTS